MFLNIIYIIHTYLINKLIYKIKICLDIITIYYITFVFCLLFLQMEIKSDDDIAFLKVKK